MEDYIKEFTQIDVDIAKEIADLGGIKFFNRWTKIC